MKHFLKIQNLVISFKNPQILIEDCPRYILCFVVIHYHSMPTIQIPLILSHPLSLSAISILYLHKAS